MQTNGYSPWVFGAVNVSVSLFPCWTSLVAHRNLLHFRQVILRQPVLAKLKRCVGDFLDVGIELTDNEVVWHLIVIGKHQRDLLARFNHQARRVVLQFAGFNTEFNLAGLRARAAKQKQRDDCQN